MSEEKVSKSKPVLSRLRDTPWHQDALLSRVNVTPKIVPSQPKSEERQKQSLPEKDDKTVSGVKESSEENIENSDDITQCVNDFENPLLKVQEGEVSAKSFSVENETTEANSHILSEDIVDEVCKSESLGENSDNKNDDLSGSQNEAPNSADNTTHDKKDEINISAAGYVAKDSIQQNNVSSTKASVTDEQCLQRHMSDTTFQGTVRPKDPQTRLKFNPNLSKSPISVIELSESKDRSSGFAETLSTVQGLDYGQRKLTTRDHDKETARAPSIEDKTSAELPKIKETNTDINTDEESSISTISTCKSERTAVRRRLSKTIEALQEKLQQEITSGQKSHQKQMNVESHTPDPKKVSEKAINRFARERSRKRSKSRLAFKVMHSARRNHPVNTKERPYRQWAGVGNCVTADTRFIVSSTFNDKLRTDTKTESNVLPKSHTGDAQPCRAEKESSISQKGGNETDLDCKVPNPSCNTIVEKKSSPEKKPNVENRRHPANMPAIDIDDDAPAASLSPSPCKHLLSSTVSTDLEMEEKSAKETLKFGSVLRERSKFMRRAATRAEKQLRAPTPHSKLPRTDVITEESPSSVRLAVLNRPKTSGSKQGLSSDHTLVGENQAQLVKTNRDQEGTRSPSMCVIKGRHNSTAKSKLPFHVGMRSSSKPLPGAVKRHRRWTSPRTNHRKLGASMIYSGHESDNENKCKLADKTISDHGSVDTLWSDLSSTTCESSLLTENSSMSGRRTDVSPVGTWKQAMHINAEDATLNQQQKSTSLAIQSRRYMDVQAVADFKGSLPGQLSFSKGQIIKQLVNYPIDSAPEMSYGYYRIGRLKRKKKGLYPSSCVTLCQTEK